MSECSGPWAPECGYGVLEPNRAWYKAFIDALMVMPGPEKLPPINQRDRATLEQSCVTRYSPAYPSNREYE